MILDIYRYRFFISFDSRFQFFTHTQIEIEFTSSNEFNIILCPIFIININYYSNFILLLYKFM